MTLMPINPAFLMSKSLVQGVGTSRKPQSPQETKAAFVEMLLDQVFLKSFMTEEEGVFAPEEDSLFPASQDAGLYKEMVRREMIHQMAADERFGFSGLFANVPSLPQ